jgi:ABC-type Fe3+/spermidine/putrescine transport system ATPase subunit
MLRARDVSHAYGDTVSLRDVALAVDDGEILCLLGPSGCGKTTLLRIIAGLEPKYQGAIAFDGADIRPIPAHKRGFGLMFQDFALFPHLSVAENIAYGLKRLGMERKAIGEEVRSLMRRVGLADLDKRDVASLSGGQKQRVALARSLAPNPRLLMLDEPLGSLDAQLRDQLALELRRIVKSAGLSAIYVTHDHREAYAIADSIAVMNEGKVIQHDAPRDLYRRPRCEFVARFLGMSNVLPTSDGRMRELLGADEAAWAGASSVLIHPMGITLADDKDSGALAIDSIVKDAIFRGAFADVTAVTATGLPLSFTLADVSVSVGDSLRIGVESDAVMPLADSIV